MPDRTSLQAWVQPSHLERRAIAICRQAFLAHPARMLVLKDFLLDAVAERLSRFLSHEACFEAAYGLYAKNVRDGNIAGVSATAWLEAAAGQRFYRFSDYAGVRDEFQHSANQRVFQQFFAALRSGPFRRFYEAISGLALGPAPLINAYAYGSGDFLSHHSDDVKSKRLSFVFYLTPGWERRFGGVLHMVHPDGEVTEVAPDYNSLVVFDVAAQTRHFISAVEPCAGESRRLTVSGWFLTP